MADKLHSHLSAECFPNHHPEQHRFTLLLHLTHQGVSVIND